jgi:sarcosine oxidase subunit beta
MARIVVIGAGITGTATAEVLARQGENVTLLEKAGVAAMASGWTLAGVRQSGRDPAELPLAQAAVAMWGDLHERLGAETDYRRKGNLRLARTEAEVPVIRQLVADQRAMGLDLTYLADNAAVRAVAPAMSERVLAASFCPSDGHADPVKTTRAFAASARRHGAVIREGVGARAIRVTAGRVAGVETDGEFFPADSVVVAAGVNTPALVRPLGLDLPISVKLVSVLQSAPLPPLLEQVFGVANADCAGRQQVDGRLRVTNGLGDWPGDPAAWSEAALAPSAEDLAALRALVAHFLPAIAEVGIAKSWGGLIDLTPDALPVLDAPEAVGGLVIAAGFSGHGFCLGPVSGEICAALALGEAPRHDLGAFRLARFAGGGVAQAELSLHG